MALATYDGSGEAVHPDVVTTPGTWGENSLHLVVTPYPGGNPTFENPSIYVGHYVGASLSAWSVPSGVQNPLVRPAASGYLSDPDELYDPATNQLWLYYRQVTTVNQILLIRSSDGVTWSAPVPVVTVSNHLAISPAVVRRGANDWWMWTINGGTDGCAGRSTTVELRQSVDGVTWSAPQTVSMGDGTQFPWHVDVTWVASRGEFWAVYNAKNPGSCTTPVLRFATSPDGVHWTVAPGAVLRRGALPEFADIVYRASLSYDPTTDGVTLWYSGARYTGKTYVWRVAEQEMTRATLFDLVSRPAAAAPQMRSERNTPPLTNETAP